MESPDWPALPYEEWAPTKKTLHMCAQMLGKTRLALAPPQPEWLHACLLPRRPRLHDGRRCPVGGAVVTMGIDVFDGDAVDRAERRAARAIRRDRPGPLRGRHLGATYSRRSPTSASTSTSGRSRRRSPTPPRSPRTATTAPSCPSTRSASTGPLRRSTACSRSSARGSSAGAASSSGGARSTSRCCCSTGTHADAPDDRGYIMRYDLDAEHLNAGFWPGDDNAPRCRLLRLPGARVPTGCETAPIEPAHAGWVEAMGEWMMPYEAVRDVRRPARRRSSTSSSSVYRVAIDLGGWDARVLRSTRHRPRPRGAQLRDGRSADERVPAHAHRPGAGARGADAGLRGVPRDRAAMGAPAQVPGVRARRVLRPVDRQARHRARRTRPATT